MRARFPGRERRFRFLPGPELDIASTGIRARVASGRSIVGLVPASVLGYIEEHELYTGEGGEA